MILKMPTTGIDDMFVPMQCFNNLDEEEQKRTREERFGLTLRRAGAAITVTSLTDFLAFAMKPLCNEI